MVVSFNSGDVVVYDLETCKSALVLKGQGEGSKPRPRHHLFEYSPLLCHILIVFFCSPLSHPLSTPPALPDSNHINKVVSHPTLPVTITAHEDRHIKFYDNKSGQSLLVALFFFPTPRTVFLKPSGPWRYCRGRVL